MSKRKIVSLVGTSILTHQPQSDDDPRARRGLPCAGKSPADRVDCLEEADDNRREAWQSACVAPLRAYVRNGVEGLARLSGLARTAPRYGTHVRSAAANLAAAGAELASLAVILNQSPMAEGEDLRLLFVASDTKCGKLCADIACAVAKEVWKPAPVEVQVCAGLNVDQPNDVLTALETSLPELLDATAAGLNAEDKLIINISGGFKVVLPGVGIWAVRAPRPQQISLCYLFEKRIDGISWSVNPAAGGPRTGADLTLANLGTLPSSVKIKA